MAHLFGQCKRKKKVKADLVFLRYISKMSPTCSRLFWPPPQNILLQKYSLIFLKNVFLWQRKSVENQEPIKKIIKIKRKHLDTNLFLYWPALASLPCQANREIDWHFSFHMSDSFLSGADNPQNYSLQLPCC